MLEEQAMQELTLLPELTEGAVVEAELRLMVTAAQGQLEEWEGEETVGTLTAARPVPGGRHRGPGRVG